jgi:hypothetical protein
VLTGNKSDLSFVNPSAIAFGAADFARKPITPGDLISLIDRNVKEAREPASF